MSASHAATAARGNRRTDAGSRAPACGTAADDALAEVGCLGREASRVRSGRMCASCVAQGTVYVGGALAGLQVMAARARRRRAVGTPDGNAPDAGTRRAGAPDRGTSDGGTSGTGTPHAPGAEVH